MAQYEVLDISRFVHILFTLLTFSSPTWKLARKPAARGLLLSFRQKTPALPVKVLYSISVGEISQRLQIPHHASQSRFTSTAATTNIQAWLGNNDL